MSQFEELDDDLQDDLPLGVAERLLAYEQGVKTPLPRHGESPATRPLPQGEGSEAISDTMACVDLLHRVWPDMDPHSRPSPSLSAPRNGETDPPPQQLGDFRILGEVGRGGMGVVYEAEQISLGRRVALKVLPFAAMLDRQQLARFKNEARAAATLDHPNIVAIHSVGCERSVHYYAMQLIEGRSLAEVIAHLKPGRPPSEGGTVPIAVLTKPPAADDTAKAALPTAQSYGSAAFSSLPRANTREFYRSAARLGIQAAEALDHAHQNGILHRDIKPANLLVDDGGKLWVTDFGLARVEADAGMTMTGDLLGTLRYMSPEQALAKRVVVDHRTDIYSLGATLYELLTQQPAFAETDRAKLLQQIAYEEPRPLRKIDEHVPAELETIVLKAMAKHREERYQTAEQFADDLRAFLENRPIKARPPGLPHRMAKWSRRHQTLISTAAVALVLLSVILTVSIVKVQSAKTVALAALEETADLLYTTDMTLAYQTYEKGWSDEVQTILNRHRPSRGEPDRRGYEWHLLQTLVQQPSPVTLSAHNGPVNELAVFPDRRRLASVGNDGTLRIWDIRDGKLERSVSLCDHELHSVAVSPDGRYIAAGSDALYLYDIVKAGAARKLFVFEYTIDSLAFSADGNEIALGTRYDEMCLISRDGQMIKRMPSTSRLESMEFLPTTHQLLVPNRRITAGNLKLGTAQILHADLSGMVQEFDATDDTRPTNITVVRSSPCGKFIVAGEERGSRAHIFDLQTRQILAQTPVSRAWLHDLCYAPDGKSIAIGYGNGQVEVFGVRTDAEEQPFLVGRSRVLAAHQGEVKSVRFVDAATLASCGADGLVRIWPLSAAPARTLELADLRMVNMGLSPSGRRLLCVGYNGFQIIDTGSGRIVFRCSMSDAHYTGAAWSSRGDKAAVGSNKAGTVTILDAAGNSLFDIRPGDWFAEFAFSPDDSRLAIIGETHLQIVSAKDGRELYRRSLPGHGKSLAFSHDGRLIACGGDWESILLFDSELQPVHEFRCESHVNCLTFSPDDSILVSGHHDSIIRAWETGTGRLREEFVGHQRTVSSLAFSGDGRTLASAGYDGAARLWSIEHGRGFGSFYHRVMGAAVGESCRLCLSSDGRHLVLGYLHPRDGLPDLLLWRIDASASD